MSNDPFALMRPPISTSCLGEILCDHQRKRGVLPGEEHHHYDNLELPSSNPLVMKSIEHILHLKSEGRALVVTLMAALTHVTTGEGSFESAFIITQDGNSRGDDTATRKELIKEKVTHAGHVHGVLAALRQLLRMARDADKWEEPPCDAKESLAYLLTALRALHKASNPTFLQFSSHTTPEPHQVIETETPGIAQLQSRIKELENEADNNKTTIHTLKASVQKLQYDNADLGCSIAHLKAVPLGDQAGLEAALTWEELSEDAVARLVENPKFRRKFLSTKKRTREVEVENEENAAD